MAKKILLACAGGFSTSMLVANMQDAAKEKGIEVSIEAIGTSNIEDELPADIIMLGPQMGHSKDAIKKRVGDVPVTVIGMQDYGMVNGENVLNEALSIIEDNQ